MLAADVSVQQAVGLFCSGVENLLGVFAERNLDGRFERRGGAGARVNRLPEPVGSGPCRAEQMRHELFRLLQDSKQEMLRLDEATAEHTRLVPREEQRSPGRLVISLKHGRRS